MTDPPFLTPAQEARIHALIHITPAMRHYSLTMAVLMVLFEALGLLSFSTGYRIHGAVLTNPHAVDNS